MKYPFVLGLDPSGAFAEGKGTTGWVLLDAEVKKVIKKNSIYAREYAIDTDYWQSHVRLLEYLNEHYGRDGLSVVMEDYLLYADKAQSQVNSRFETSQLIGIIKMTCARHELPLFIQTAGEVKRRWDNNVLLKKGIIRPHGRGFALVDPFMPINKHELDALRHGLHLSYFYNK